MTDENQNTELNNQEENTNPDFTKEDPTLNQANQMEVHHAHHPSHKKKWNEYILEFLMLFLAVYLGFMAENHREHNIEEKREKNYMKSLINDLKADSASLEIVILDYKKAIIQQDSLLAQFPEIENGYKKNLFSKLIYFKRFEDFVYSDATIQQLKNGGNFRLIRNTKVVEKIMMYDGTVRTALGNEDNLSKLILVVQDGYAGIINVQEFQQQLNKGKTMEQIEAMKIDVLMTHDKAALNKFYNNIRFYNLVSKTLMRQMEDVKKANAELIPFIEKEYDLKDDSDNTD